MKTVTGFDDNNDITLSDVTATATLGTTDGNDVYCDHQPDATSGTSCQDSIVPA